MFFNSDSAGQRKLGITLAFGAVIWSGTYNALAKGLTPFLSPITLLLLSEALTAVFIILTFGIVPLCKELRTMNAKSIAIAAGIGLLNSAVAPLLWFTGLARTSAINASMLSSAEVLCVLILGSVLLHEKIGRMQALGGLTVFVGIVIINVATVSESISVHVGDVLVLLGAFTSGTGAVLFKKYISHVMPELAIAIRNVAAIIAVSIASFFLSHSFGAEVAAFPLRLVVLLLAFTFFSRYLNLTFYYEALDRLPATTVSLIEIATPLAGLTFAFLILGEQIHANQMLGGIFIVFGLMLEQVSANTMKSIRSRSIFRILPFHRKETATPVMVLPRNV